MKVQPIGDKVIIKRVQAPEKTSSGIIITSTKPKNTYATVVAVGNGIINENGILVPLTVKPGDKILLSASVGIDIKVDGDDNAVIAEKDILAIVDEIQE